MTDRTRRKRLPVRAALVAVLLVPAWCSYNPFARHGQDLGAPLEDSERWVSGALHVHSDYSDGAGGVEAISRAAADAGLDFWVLTDHSSLEALERGQEGYFDEVLMLVGVEATTDVGHVLGLDLPATPLVFGRGNPEEALEQIGQLGGFALAAHPDADQDSFHWKGWDLGGYQGIEVFNAYSAYRRNGILASLAYFFVRPFWQTEMLTWKLDWDPTLVATWDNILAERKLAAWAGTDAHGGIRFASDRFVEWPSYERVFRMAQNHLLLERPLTGIVAPDRELIYLALREGRGYVALNDRDGSSQFRFWAETEGKQWPMGSDLPLLEQRGAITLRASVPASDVRLRLFRNGTLVAEEERQELTYRSEVPGVYRVEAGLRVSSIGGRTYEPWIMSNPISLLPQPDIEARISANALPEPELHGFETTDLEEYPLVLGAEQNPGCTQMELTKNAFGKGSFRLRFKLEIPAPDHENSHVNPGGLCAVADRNAHDLTEYAGIHFETRGDAIYRVNVLLVGPDAESRDEISGWIASFLATGEWQDVTIPFSRFQPLRQYGGKLNLAQVTGISFIFDTYNTLPETSGQVDVKDFSLITAP